ncbi:MAG: DNA ligase D [Planctomycetota bacterium]|nr:DNA ligase D [Planctomycetota bacterium]
MTLTEYRRKRNFKRTPEPRGRRTVGHPQLSFVIQKHAASHLHYDFRLELDGVLKSWAVPKGPSLDPAAKRLAMQVEDHPVEYGSFEGIIPQGEYGGGTVMLWDQGTWESVGDAKRDYLAGRLKLVLHGEKLHGGWMLVRKGGRRTEGTERHWWLFKERDEFAEPDVDIVAQLPLSVTTGRDLDGIAAQADRVWGAAGEMSAKQHSAHGRRATPARRKAIPSSTRQVVKKYKPKVANRKQLQKELRRLAPKRAALPQLPLVELATLAKQAPTGDQWFHEIKYDGYRMLCRIDGKDATFISRNGKNWTSQFPELAQAAAQLGLKSGVLDGEVVALDAEGRTSFQKLQNAFQGGLTGQLVFYVFDLLFVDGYDLTADVLEDRKKLLHYVVQDTSRGPLRYSEHLIGDGPKFLSEACRMKLEGIICKRRDRAYISGRGKDWLKVKCSLREEFVVGGFTFPSGSRSAFGALLVGYYDAKGQLIYAGRVGTGFDDRTLTDLHAQLRKLSQRKSPFVNLSGTTGQERDVTWVKPKLVAQVQFSNWTDNGLLRHPSFQGLRKDKAATEVIHERATSVHEVSTAASNGSHRTGGRRTGKAAATSAPVRQMKSNGPVEVAGIVLSNPDKVLYPADGITKRDLANYYEAVAEWMLPHVENRLLALVRCPDGYDKQCFFQKHPAVGTSDVFKRIAVREKNKTEQYLAINNTAGLVSLVQMGVLEIHTWGSQAARLEKPDRIILDLDPDEGLDWSAVVTAARELRGLLEELGLKTFLKTTGGKGLHVVVPIQRRHSWPQIKEFCLAIADFMTRLAPDRFVATMSKAARRGKIFVDYLRNDRGATAIAPYSTRARAGAPVSVPIAWNELSSRRRSDHFTIHNVPLRLRQLRRDPWAKLAQTQQAITSEMLSRLNNAGKPR